jgi:hypothetical protein
MGMLRKMNLGITGGLRHDALVSVQPLFNASRRAVSELFQPIGVGNADLGRFCVFDPVAYPVLVPHFSHSYFIGRAGGSISSKIVGDGLIPLLLCTCAISDAFRFFFCIVDAGSQGVGCTGTVCFSAGYDQSCTAGAKPGTRV